jgi:hypothetical protein
MAFFQKPPWEKCWAAVGCGWATWASARERREGREGGLSPRRGKRELSLSFFSCFYFFPNQFKFEICLNFVWKLKFSKEFIKHSWAY